MSKTLLKKINIIKFRALQNVEVEFGTDITLICGKNGTAKSYNKLIRFILFKISTFRDSVDVILGTLDPFVLHFGSNAERKLIFTP